MSRRERGHRALADQLVRELAPRRYPNPVLVLWRWRWELAVVVAAVVLVRTVAPQVLVPAVGAAVGLGGTVPVLRRLLRDRFWCVATQHRLRLGLRESDVRSWSGRLPGIVWTSARPYGERVLLAFPAGVDAARLASCRGELAAACWAVDVTVAPDPRHANLVAVDVVRRKPGAPS